MTASQLLIDGKTCINIKDKSPEQIASDLLKFVLDYENVSKNVYSKFKEIVNFDNEFLNIKNFMENLR